MADVLLTRGKTLPDSCSKTDFHELVDLATGSISNIVNADISNSAAITDTKLATISTAGKVSVSALTVASQAQGDIVYASSGSAWARLAKGTAGQALIMNAGETAPEWGSGFTPTAANALAGSVVQVVNTQTGAVSSGSTALPDDDTIPQNTEGDEVMTLAITPKSATNKLKIEVVTSASNNGGYGHVTALFQDTTAGALACSKGATPASGNAYLRTVSFTHYMTAGTTSATTFKVRIGAPSSTTTFNGTAGARQYGGALASSITITEIKA